MKIQLCLQQPDQPYFLVLTLNLKRNSKHINDRYIGKKSGQFRWINLSIPCVAVFIFRVTVSCSHILLTFHNGSQGLLRLQLSLTSAITLRKQNGTLLESKQRFRLPGICQFLLVKFYLALEKKKNLLVSGTTESTVFCFFCCPLLYCSSGIKQKHATVPRQKLKALTA